MPNVTAITARRANQRNDHEKADIMLELPATPGGTNTRVVPLTMQQAWDIRNALADAMHPHAGKSLIQKLWEEQDAAMDRLQSDPDDESAKGECRMGARMIAILTSASYQTIRTQTRARWTARNR